MRKILSLALTALMILSVLSVGVFTTTASAAESTVGKVEAGYTPKGTAINTAADFAAMVSGGEYYLNADITIDTTYEATFSGTLDGNGKTITVSQPLFKYVENFTMKNAVINGEIDWRNVEVEDAWHVGTIAMEGEKITLDNIVNNADVYGFQTAKTIVKINAATGAETISYDSIYAGGFLGSVYGDLTITNCDNYGTVCSLVTGGFVGSLKKVPKAKEDEAKEYYKVEIHALFENCNNFGLVTDEGCEDLIVDNGDGTKTNKKQGLAGGIISYALATTITFRNCHNTADVLSDNTGEDMGPGSKLNADGSRNHAGEHVGGGVAGGICGRALQSSSQYHNDVYFYNCTNSGNVVGWSQIGGIGGYINCGVHVFSCENRGQITSKGNYAAGIIGRPGTDYENSGYTHDFIDCVNTGDVIAHRQYAGGISSYSRDRINMARCLNTGDMIAEGVSATTQHPDQHTVQCAGIMVNTSYTGFFSYCVNTGNMISNQRAAGICASAGSEESSKYGGGYTTLVGCLNLGDINVYARNNGLVLSQEIHYINASGKDAFRYYWSEYNAAGILGYTWGGGAAQAPRIIGCGVQGTISTDWGCACGLMGYANTAYAMLQYNYVIADINGPGETELMHQITRRTDYATEYLAAWIDRCDSLRYVYGNYCYADYANKYMMMQNNGADVDFAGYDCYITKDDLESGKVAYMLNDLVYQDYEDFGMGIKCCFAQDLTGKDGKFPTSPYYYLTLEGPLDNRVIVGFGNVVEKDGDGYKNVDIKIEEETTEETTEEEVTTKEEEVTTKEEEVTTKAEEVTTAKPEDVTTAGGDDTTKPAEGGCGGVIGASVALVALALIAPAGIMLKKKED